MLRIISLFTGIGGLDLGLEAAGFQVAVAVELDRDAVGIIRKNRDWTVVEREGRPLPMEQVLDKTALVAGARNHLQATRSLAFRFQVTA